MNKTKQSKKKVTITLDEDVYVHLKEIVEINHVSMTQWLTQRICEVNYVDIDEYFR